MTTTDNDAVYTEDWISKPQLRLLGKAAAYAKQCHSTGSFVEVGVWEGRSAITIAQAINPRTLHAVDHWLGDIDNPHTDEGVRPELLENRDVFAQFQRNVRAARLSNICVEKMSWQAFFQRSQHLALAFVHLDGAHDYSSVYDNLIAFLALSVPEAIFCGDDAQHPEVAAAVRDAFSSAQYGERPLIGVADCPNFWLKELPLRGK